MGSGNNARPVPRQAPQPTRFQPRQPTAGTSARRQPQAPNMPQQAPAAPRQPQAAQQQPQQANVATNVPQGPVYPTNYIQQAQNMGHAMGVPAYADLANAAGMAGVGFQSGAVQAGLGAAGGQQMSQAAMAPLQIGQQFGMANAQNDLAQQQLANQQGGMLYGLGQQGRAQDQQFQFGQQNNLLNFLAGLQRWA